MKNRHLNLQLGIRKMKQIWSPWRMKYIMEPYSNSECIFCEALKEKEFADIETVECLMRGMQVERGKTRPQTLMTAHTGYITYARKTVRTTPRTVDQS